MNQSPSFNLPLFSGLAGLGVFGYLLSSDSYSITGPSALGLPTGPLTLGLLLVLSVTLLLFPSLQEYFSIPKPILLLLSLVGGGASNTLGFKLLNLEKSCSDFLSLGWFRVHRTYSYEEKLAWLQTHLSNSGVKVPPSRLELTVHQASSMADLRSRAEELVAAAILETERKALEAEALAKAVLNPKSSGILETVTGFVYQHPLLTFTVLTAVFGYIGYMYMDFTQIKNKIVGLKDASDALGEVQREALLNSNSATGALIKALEVHQTDIGNLVKRDNELAVALKDLADGSALALNKVIALTSRFEKLGPLVGLNSEALVLLRDLSNMFRPEDLQALRNVVVGERSRLAALTRVGAALKS